MKKRLWRIIIGAAIFLGALYTKRIDTTISLTLFILSYLVIGYDVVLEALCNIFKGKVFDENFLMSLASIGAFTIGEYPEAVAVMLFYQVGELFQSYAVGKSRKSISSLMDIRPDHANVIRGQDTLTVSPYDVKIGETIIVRPGEKIPLDGTVKKGSSMLDTSALTGESVPRSVKQGEEVLSGSVNMSSVIEIMVTKEFGESTVSKILDLVENASSKKSKSESFITRFAAIYTPIVVVLAVLLAFLPPLVMGWQHFDVWLYRALTFLVVSCPCALVISVPLSFFGGIGGASKKGVLVKGSNYLEALSRAEIAVFDKTGTLTKGVFEVSDISPVGISDEELLRYGAYCESFSTHPIAMSIVKAYGKEIDKSKVSMVEEVAGRGIKATIQKQEVLCGNYSFMKENNISCGETDVNGTVVYVAVNKTFVGLMVISDVVKPDSIEAIQKLKAYGVKKVVMLTGDNENTANKVAKELLVDEYYAGLLPFDKVKKVEELLKNKSEKGTLIFTGDGINDAPVLARADVGISMGGVGSDAAIEASDVVIMTDEPSKIADAVSIARKTISIANQNIAFALIVKIGVLVLSAFGFATMWEAVFADVGVSVIAILNAMRTLKTKNV